MGFHLTKYTNKIYLYCSDKQQKKEFPMCSLENAIETLEKSAFISHELFKILLDNYSINHTDDEVQLLLDNDDIGLATNGEIEILLHGLRDENEQLVKDKERLKEEILALQGSANAFQISKCESCQESQRADKELTELNKLVDKYNELAHKYNALESTKLSQIEVHHFPDEIPSIPKDDTCVSLYLFPYNETDDLPCNLNDSSLWYQFEIDKAFRKGSKPCYFIYASDVKEAIKTAVNAKRRSLTVDDREEKKV